MNPIDFRNLTFADLKARGLEGLRGRVLAAWSLHGPCTTKELAEKSGISILTLRPRTTELYQLGLVVLDSTRPLPPATRPSGEGRYRAATETEAFGFFKNQQVCATTGQRELSLGS